VVKKLLKMNEKTYRQKVSAGKIEPEETVTKIVGVVKQFEKTARGLLATIFGLKRITWCEPTHGSSVGGPDMWLWRGVEWGYLPCELKRCERVVERKGEGKFIYVSVEPSQVNWHVNQKQCGATTIFLVMISEGTNAKNSQWAICLGEEVHNWRDGGMRAHKICFGSELCEALGVDGVVY